MLRIGRVTVDPASREVHSRDGPISLERRAFEVLLYLIEHRERAVSREELFGRVWPGRVVTDDVLYRAIGMLRSALKIADVGELIRTVHGVGYQFVAPVSTSSDEARFVALLALRKSDDRSLPIPLANEPVAAELEGTRLYQFDSSVATLSAALACVDAGLTGGIGVAVGEIDTGKSDAFEDAYATHLSTALSKIARPNQILVSEAAFELARAHPGQLEAQALSWIAHGRFHLKGFDQSIMVHEVGVSGVAPLCEPLESKAAQKALDDDLILGWRAAGHQPIPNRAHWVLQRCLGQGGFGEAWLAQHEQTRESRVFKFCYRTDRLRSLQREVTLFRLLRETLGQRDDIARILDWNFARVPYYIESEYTSHGDLVQWAESQGGLTNIPFVLRLDLVAQTARALGSAHAVGVLHKDIKPANILVKSSDGRPRAVLADFGIGLVTDPTPLVEHSITQLGMTEALAGNVTTTRTGTRRYMAPEILEGQPPTLQADIYSLGVLLYQVVVGDFGRVLAPGWERDVEDDLLRDDISSLVDRDPEKRPRDARGVANRIERLDVRRAQRMAESERADREARERRRLRVLIPAAAIAGLFALTMGAQNFRVAQQRNLAEAEAARANAVSGFVRNLFDAADPFYQGNRTPSLQGILERGAERIQDELGNEPGVRSDLLTIMGQAFTALGDQTQAQALLRRSIEDARSIADPLAQAAALTQLGASLTQSADYAGAATAYREALTLLGDGGQLPHDRLIADALAGDALRSYREAQLPQATRLIEEALSRLDSHYPSDDSTMQALKALALTFRSEQVDGLNEAVVAEFETLASDIASSNPNHYAYLLVLMNFADYLSKTGDYRTADEVAARATQKAEQLLGDAHPLTAKAYTKRAMTKANLSEYAEAKTLFQRALEVHDKYPDTTPETMEILAFLADLNLLTDDVPNALAHAERAMSIARNFPTAPLVSTTQHRYARALHREGRYEDARRWFQSALEATVEMVGESHWQTALFESDLSVTDAKLGNAVQSVGSASRAVEKLAAALGADHWLVDYARGNLAQVLAASGNAAEALETLQAAYPRLEVSPQTKRAYRELYLKLAAQLGRNDVAERLSNG